MESRRIQPVNHFYYQIWKGIQFKKINVITKMKPDSIDGCYQALFFQEEPAMKIEKEMLCSELVSYTEKMRNGKGVYILSG